MSGAAPTSDWPPSRPVMGYNTWYQFRTSITESVVVRQAELLVSSGLAAAGYNCVNLDDGWMAAQRAANGELTGDAAKFPRGMAWLADQVHALGLRFGLYTAIGAQDLPVPAGELGTLRPGRADVRGLGCRLRQGRRLRRAARGHEPWRR